MMTTMTRSNRPSGVELERIAEQRPALLNALVAYFVMEWKGVIISNLTHGQDQTGKIRPIPNYMDLWGVDDCIFYLLHSPPIRFARDPGFLSHSLENISKI